MRSTITTIAARAKAVLIVACLGACSGGSGDLFTPVADPSCPTCALESKHPDQALLSFVVDLGDVAVGKEATRKITVVNRGNAPFHIQESSVDLTPITTDLACAGSCGVRTVGPGGKLEIGFTVRPSNKGPIDRTISFQTDLGRGTVYVHLVANGVVPNFTCLPPGNLEFGSLVQGTSLTRKITCTNNTNIDAVLVVEPIQDDTHQFTLSLSSSDGKLLVNHASSVDIPVTFSAALLPAEIKSQQAYASIHIDNDDGSSLFAILAQGTVLASALEIDPAPPTDRSGAQLPYDFGFVSPGTSIGRKFVTLRNLGNAPLTISSLAIDGSSDREFAVIAPALTPFQIPGVIEGGTGVNEVQIELTFTPPAGDVGPRLGQLNLDSDDPAGAVRSFDLAGFGGGPTLACSWTGAPGKLDFGETAVGNPRSRTIVCTNVTRFDDPETDADNLKVLRPVMKNDFSSYQVSIPGDPLRNGYSVGQSFTLELKYAPTAPGADDDDEVVLKTNDTAHLEFHIPVTGLPRLFKPCQFNVLPAQGLDFGDVDLHRKVTLEVGLQNTGEDTCLLQDVRIDPDSSSAYSLGSSQGSGLVRALEIPVGQVVAVPVTFDPGERSAGLEGELEFEANVGPGENRTQQVHLHGSSLAPCAVVAPLDMDFGVVAPGCSSRAREMRLLNTCTTSIHVASITVAPGISDDFHVQKLPNLAAPIELRGGSSVSFEGVYRPTAEGSSTAAIFVYTTEQFDPAILTVRGSSNPSASEVDAFIQAEKPKVDVLWVVNDDFNGLATQEKVASYAPKFLAYARSQNVDFHVAVTSNETGRFNFGNCAGVIPKGRFLPIAGGADRIITADTVGADSKLTGNLDIGYCGEDETALDAATMALTAPLINSADDVRFPDPNDGNLGFLRDDATLTINFTSEGFQDDASTQPVGFYYDNFQAIKGFKDGAVRVNGIVQTTADNASGCSFSGFNNPPQKRLEDLIGRFNGFVGRECPTSMTWDEQLAAITEASFGSHSCFTLNNAPEASPGTGEVDPSTVVVRLNGVSFPDHTGKGQRTWQYDASKNAICFYPLALPEPGTEISVSYRVACL